MIESHWGLESWPGTIERKQLIQPRIVRPGPGRGGQEAGGSPCRGRSCRQGLFPPHTWPQAPCPGILHDHPHLLLLLGSCMPCELGESAPLPLGDHMPRQSSQGHSVPLPSSRACPVLLEGSVIKVAAALRVRTRCTQNCCPRRGRNPGNSRLRAVGCGAGWVVLWRPCSDGYLFGGQSSLTEDGIVHRVTLGLDGGQVHSSAQSPLNWVRPWGGGGRGCQERLAAGHVQDHLPGLGSWVPTRRPS